MNLKLATLALLYAKIEATENANSTGLRFKKEIVETARTLQSTCVNEMPTDTTNAVLIKFVRNDAGGISGDPCPIDCDAADAVKEGYYPIADATDHCYQWPGRSGHNSMRSGTCTDGDTFTYDQWPNCECSGTVGFVKRVPYGGGCVIDNPPTLCQKVIDYSACQARSVTSSPTSTSPTAAPITSSPTSASPTTSSPVSTAPMTSSPTHSTEDPVVTARPTRRTKAGKRWS